jgi:MerR family transcriptional regulator, copper efflux regulator
MNIGAAQEASGLRAKTIRYYEEIGLLVPARRGNGYRDYGENDVHKLAFLKRARGLGFSIEDCRALISLYEDRNRASSDVKSLAYTHLNRIEAKIMELEGMRAALSHLVEACHGDARPDCPILDDLSGILGGRA